MEINDIVALAKAGFTRDDIQKIAAATAPAAQETAVPPAQAAATPSVPTAWNEWGQQFLAGLNSTLQTHNLQMSQQPPEETVDDILASIIAPPAKGDK